MDSDNDQNGQQTNEPVAGPSHATTSAKNDSSDSDESVEMTAAELVRIMTVAWQNEKLSNELLPPVEEEVDCFMDQIVNLETNIEKHLPPEDDLHLPIHEMELKRVRYLLTSYLRTRLVKIQENCWFYKKQEEERRKLQEKNGRAPVSKLMPNEYKFLMEYVNIVDGHIKNVALQNMPMACQNLDKNKLAKEANIDNYIFFRSNANRTIYIPEENVDVVLTTGKQYLMRYRPIAKLLYRNEVALL